MLKKNNRINSLWLSLQFSITLIVSFITLKLNIDNFSETLFGVWILLTSFWGIGTIIDFGFGTAIIKFIARADFQNDKNQIDKIISTGFILFICLGIILFIIGNSIGQFLYFDKNIFNKNYDQNFELVFLVLGLSFLAQYLSIFFRSIFEGFSNFVLTSQLTILHSLLILISVSVVNILDFTMLTLALFYAASALILLFLYFFLFKVYFKGISYGISKFDFQRWKEMFQFSFSIQITSVFGALIDPMIKYITGVYLGLNTVTHYEVARKFSQAIAGLYANTFRTFLPKASALLKKDEYYPFLDSEGVTLLKISIVYSGFSFGILSIFIALIIKYWFGLEESIVIFLILAAAETVNNWGYMIYLFLMGIGKSLYLILVQGFNLIFILTFLFMGFRILNNYLGLIGYPFSMILVNVLMLIILERIVGKKLTFLNRVNCNKLLMLILSILLTIVMIVYSGNYIIAVGILSIISIIFFVKDILNLWNNLKSTFFFRGLK